MANISKQIDQYMHKLNQKMNSGEPGYNSNYESIASGQNGKFRQNHNLHSIFNSLARKIHQENNMENINKYFR